MRLRPDLASMARWLDSTLQVRRDEWKQLLRLWTGYAMLSCATEGARLVAEILFVSRAGIQWLPSLFAFQAVVNTAASAGYVALLHRFRKHKLFPALLAGFASVTATVGLSTAWLDSPWVFGLLFGSVEAGITLLKIHWGVYILEIYEPKSASRLFPLLFTGAALGRSVGGGVVRQATEAVGLSYLLPMVFVVTVPLAALFLRRPRASGASPLRDEPHAASASAEGSWTEAKGRPESLQTTEIGHGYREDDSWRRDEPFGRAKLPDPDMERHIASSVADRVGTHYPRRKRRQTSTLQPADPELFLKSPDSELVQIPSAGLFEGGARRKLVRAVRRCLASPLLRAMAVSTLLMVMVRHTMRYASLAVFKSSLSETALAQLLGTYALAANLAALALQLFFTPRFLKRMGVQAANIVYALSVTGGLVVVSVWGEIWAAIATRFSHSELKTSVRTPASPIFYFGEPAEHRAEARAFILGAVVPASTVIAALLLHLGQRWAELSVISWIGAGVAAFYVVACVWQNRAYSKAIGSER